VKALRVVFFSDQEQQVEAFCAWLHHHACQVEVLIMGSVLWVEDILVALAQGLASAEAAVEDSAAAAGSGGARACAVPLRRLLVTDSALLSPRTLELVLQPLLASLTNLQHLHLFMSENPHLDPVSDEELGGAVVCALQPLQHSTSLTSLVLEGPRRQQQVQGHQGSIPDATHIQLLKALPTTLRSLTWRLFDLEEAEQLSFDHLTGLTHLHLVDWEQRIPHIADGTFSALKQLRRLELSELPLSTEGLLDCKEQLVHLAPCRANDISSISKLTGLQCLALRNGEGLHVAEQLPALQRLVVGLVNRSNSEVRGWDTPWGLQQHSGLSRLQALELLVWGPHVPPPTLPTLAGLRHLHLCLKEVPVTLVVPWAWALAGLVNLEVLCVPAVLTACWQPWLTGLTRLVVLEVGGMIEAGSKLKQVPYHIPAAATHISQLLASDPSSSSSSSSSTACLSQRAAQVRVVCLPNAYSDDGDPLAATEQLRKAVAAAVPVMPPNMHLFRGSWWLLQESGVELWPAPVAARLKEVLAGCGHSCIYHN
jgi:hypothetical protein